MRMRIWRVIIHVGVAVAAGIDDLARAQNGATVLALRIVAAGSACGELLAHTFGERQATAGAGIAVRTADAVGSVFGRCHLRTQKIRVVFDLRRSRARGLG